MTAVVIAHIQWGNRALMDRARQASGLSRWSVDCHEYQNHRDTEINRLLFCGGMSGSAVLNGSFGARFGPHADPELLLSRLSFSHFAELITTEKQQERAFYEIECVRGALSVRELKRQRVSAT